MPSSRPRKTHYPDLYHRIIVRRRVSSRISMHLESQSATPKSTTSHLNMSKRTASISTRPSFETTKTEDSTASFLSTSAASSKSGQSSRTQRVWAAIKKHAKEHHESVNNAYALYYGQGQMRGPTPTSPKQYEGSNGSSG
ncbi:hypothetical protein CC80DRAFT_589343 [Byssothecium circinans]|uniref:Uncharacterized protein n=1 Tax=Byssothecium circinans TaxID=147558 RepID=A0A6A5UG16_9PLEO|nr:hypothetical protein CC80DRAFT_589343 [Byssothecium circinans]